MPEIAFVVFIYAFPILLLLLAWGAGNAIARRHEKDMARRAPSVEHVRVTDMRKILDLTPGKTPCGLVTSEVTFGIDHFRGFLGSLKNIFGGEVRSYQATLDRARREALLRLKEHTLALNCNAIANVRIDFADISGNSTVAKKASMVSIMASGTAYTAHTDATEPLATPLTTPLADAFAGADTRPPRA